MSSYIQGKDLRLFVRHSSGLYKPAAYARNCVLSVSREVVETSSRKSGKFRTKKAGRIDWKVSSDGIASKLNKNEFYSVLLSGEPVKIVFTIGEQTPSEIGFEGKGFTGNAILTELQLTASYKDISTYNVSMEGSGELSPFIYDGTSDEWFLADGYVNAYGYVLKNGKLTF